MIRSVINSESQRRIFKNTCITTQIILTCLFLLLFAHHSLTQDQHLKFSDLSDLERSEEFKIKTEQRIKDLELNIKTVGDKAIDKEIRVSAVNAAVKYFVHEEKVFQVSSLKNKKPRSFLVRKYLNRLMVLQYEKVEIEWFDSQWVTKFRQGPNGKYYGVIRIFQVFKGYGTDGKLQYSDKTSKDIEVEIEILQMDLGDATKEVLNVKLGDVKVQETRNS